MLTEKNKAGYTAISCGRVGRGGNTRFPIFQLERDGPTDRPTNQPTDGRTDKASYRVACPQLKNGKKGKEISGKEEKKQRKEKRNKI